MKKATIEDVLTIGALGGLLTLGAIDRQQEQYRGECSEAEWNSFFDAYEWLDANARDLNERYAGLLNQDEFLWLEETDLNVNVYCFDDNEVMGRKIFFESGMAFNREMLNDDDFCHKVGAVYHETAHNELGSESWHLTPPGMDYTYITQDWVEEHCYYLTDTHETTR